MTDAPLFVRQALDRVPLQRPVEDAAPPPVPTQPEAYLRSARVVPADNLPPHYAPVWPPYAHQSQALGVSWNQEGYAYLMEMGTGKSKVLIDNACLLFELGEIDRLLIFAPKGTYANWVKKELPAHLWPRIAEKAVVHLWRGGHTKTEQRDIDWLMKAPGRVLRILVVNTEGYASSTKCERAVDTFVRGGKTMGAVDESSTMKNPRAARSIKLHKLRDRLEYRRILTGSPVPQGPLDLWSQFEFVERAALGSNHFIGFRSRFAHTKKTDFNRGLEAEGEKKHEVTLVVGYKNLDRLSHLVDQHAYIVRKVDCLDLPPKIFTERDVELTPEQQRHYEEMREWATTQLDSGAFASSQIVITQLLRLHQIACGHLVDEVGEVHTLPTSRPALLSEVLDEAGGKTIVWATYRHDIDRLMKHLQSEGRRVVRYDGQTSTRDREAAVVAFQEGDAEVFLGNPSVGGYGITLTAASTVVYYSNSYDLEKRMQSEDRAHRIGQTRSVTYVDMIARGTVDERIIAALREKEQISQMIMGGDVERLRALFR